MGGGVGGGVGSLATSLKLRKSIVNRFNSIYKNNIDIARVASRIVVVNYFYLVHSIKWTYLLEKINGIQNNVANTLYDE
jgi:hypothetical protein